MAVRFFGFTDGNEVYCWCILSMGYHVGVHNHKSGRHDHNQFTSHVPFMPVPDQVVYITRMVAGRIEVEKQ